MPKPVLYGHPLSAYSRKARLVLLFQGVDHDYEITAPHADNADFRMASPLGKIPAFRDEHVSFADSSVITHYLDRFYEGNNLLPKTQAAFARSLWFEEYADTVMTPVIGGHLFAEMVLAERLFRRAIVQGDIDKALNEELPEIYAFLDSKLDGGAWLAGDTVSVGDIAVGGLMLSLYHCHQTVPDSAPNLQAFVERFFELEPVQQVMAEEVQVLGAVKYDTPLAGRVAA